VGALLRIGLWIAVRNDAAFRVPALDGAFYHVWARSLIEGKGDFQGPYFLGPLYPHFLAWLYRLFGPEPLAARSVQVALGIVVSVLVWSLARRLFGRATARAAVLLFALFGALAFYEHVLVMESLLVTLTFAALWVLLVPRWPDALRGAVAGVLLGLASLGRPTVLVVAPVIWLALRDSTRRELASAETKRRTAAPGQGVWRGLAACAMAWLAIVAPVLVRNARAGGGLVISTNGGVNFYAGNNADANGRFHAPPGVRFFTSPVLASAQQASLPPAVAARELTVRAVAGTEMAADSRAWRDRAWQWMAAHPGDALGLWLRKLWLVLQAREIAQLESYDFQVRRIPALRLFCVDFGWLWPLAALGIWQARREQRRGVGVLLCFIAAMLFPCIVFFVTARYRLGCVPAVAVLAGHGAATWIGWWRAREVRRALVVLVLLLPLVVATRLGARPPRGSEGWEQAQMAERLYALGDLPGAIASQERAAALLPDRTEVQLNLALYWSERKQPGDLERAEGLLRSLAQRHPGDAIVHFNFGVVLESAGKLDEARAEWGEALRLDPSFEPARSSLIRTQRR
jgi:4-amino-4-deoxy-L-arabinose transferase-like glycosyltransferase